MMRKLCLGLFFLACAFGQNSLTITASRSIAPPPDQAVFGVYVTSNANTDLAGVVAALTGTGITAGNLSNISSYQNGNGQTVNWNFTLNVSFSQVSNTVGVLNALVQNIGRNNSGLQLSYNGQGTAVSPQLQAAQTCPITDLIADARAQAQTLANAAGATVGPILALSDRNPQANASAGVGYASFLLGIPGVNGNFAVLSPPPTPISCTIIVRFSLLR